MQGIWAPSLLGSKDPTSAGRHTMAQRSPCATNREACALQLLSLRAPEPVFHRQACLPQLGKPPCPTVRESLPACPKSPHKEDPVQPVSERANQSPLKGTPPSTIPLRVGEARVSPYEFWRDTDIQLLAGTQKVAASGQRRTKRKAPVTLCQS